MAHRPLANSHIHCFCTAQAAFVPPHRPYVLQSRDYILSGPLQNNFAGLDLDKYLQCLQKVVFTTEEPASSGNPIGSLKNLIFQVPPPNMNIN